MVPSIMDDNKKNSEELDQKNSKEAPLNEHRFWEIYLAVIQQRLKTGEKINEGQ